VTCRGRHPARREFPIKHLTDERHVHRQNLQLLVGAVFLSALGDWLALTALALHLEDTTGSGLAVAALFIALWLPLVLLAAPAGLLVDRFDPRRVVVVASLAQAAVVAVLALTSSLVPILALTALLGAATRRASSLSRLPSC